MPSILKQCDQESVEHEHVCMAFEVGTQRDRPFVTSERERKGVNPADAPTFLRHCRPASVIFFADHSKAALAPRAKPK